MGGRVFINKETGENPVFRIPSDRLVPIAQTFMHHYAEFFERIEFVTPPDLQNKEDHGDIDFVALPKDSHSREALRKEFDKTRQKFLDLPDHPNQPLFAGEREHVKATPAYKWVSNGRMDHFCYPDPTVYGFGSLHQMDVIWANGPNDFKNKVFFYSNPTTFNAVLGHFARSIGYKFSDLGLHVHVTDRRKQNFFAYLTDELEKMMQILMLPMPDLKFIFEKPENFVAWITSSAKFDSRLFEDHHNNRSHRDSKKDSFCEEVYRQLQESNCKAAVPPVKIDFADEDPDLDAKLQVEKLVLGSKIVQRVMDQIEERSKIATPVISGSDLISWGFQPGPDFKTIIQDVSEKFSVEDSLDDKRQYVESKYKTN